MKKGSKMTDAQRQRIRDALANRSEEAKALHRERTSAALRRRTDAQKRATTRRANEVVRERAAQGEWAPTSGFTPWNKGLTRETDARLAEMGDARKGLANPVFSTKDGRTHRERVTEARERNGTQWPTGAANPAFGHVYGGSPIRLYGEDSDREVCYRSTWEAAFAEYLRAQGIEFRYEPETFDFGEFTYTPDFYVPKWDTFVEVKGYWRDDDREKVSAFLASGRRLIVVDAEVYKQFGLDRFRFAAAETDRVLRSRRWTRKRSSEGTRSSRPSTRT